MNFFNNLNLRGKILVPLAIVSILLAVSIFFYFQNLYSNSKQEEMITQARMAVLSAEAARDYTADQYRAEIFRNWNTDSSFQKLTLEQKRSKILLTVPIFSAMQVVSKKAKDLGYQFKVPNSDRPRNPDNEPDAKEAEVINLFKQKNVSEHFFIDQEKNTLRYFRPVYLTEDCLSCHGDPGNSATKDGKDILGMQMENLKVGDLRGAFEITMPLDAIQAETQQKSFIIALIALVGALGIMVVGFLISNTVVKPIARLKDASTKVAAGDVDVVVDITSEDEVGKLSESFNSMTHNIKDMIRTGKERESYLEGKIDTLLHEMDKLAQGNLDVGVEVDRDDEIGKLYSGFNMVVTSVRDIISEVRSAVESTASAAGQISSSTEELAAGAQEQSAQTHEVAAAVEQMARTITDNAHTSVQTAEKARSNGKVAEDGGEVVQNTVSKIREIADVVQKSTETVERLGKSSAQIGEIVSVINDIADQTNLLALNAAIEAARAGEQGRGFAVVADEVRRLAERTTQATKEIAVMIKGIQGETQQAVNMMKRGNEEVAQGIRLADQAGESLQAIVSNAKEVVGLINQIAAASEEQSATSEQIAKNVEAISHVAQESAKGVSEIARTSTDLSMLTEQLRTLVDRFVLTEDWNRKRSSSGPKTRMVGPGSGYPRLNS